ncbi:hypothetical protein HMPREF9699_00509 [Bergeyella zoohelcum ATCC 43767]|uniref:Uncharacterized protein n=2 Tax=Bergeyella zoohelcum TaxID=1015 RepID=K1M936_9FLAO|nr:hypothetical protein HMPREF9699_00509 [Bergeyella zoohelcum ATCC 43767]SUV49302.1 Uncharacterised protein [Bergeyella zoohelcum]
MLPQNQTGKYIKMEKGFMVEYKKDIFGNSIKKSGSMKIAKTIHENNASKIWVSPGLKGVRVDGHYMAKSILNHEFIHARHVMLGLNNTRVFRKICLVLQLRLC